MIVAKYRYIHDKIMKDLQHIDRRYRAHVKGIVKAGGTIRLPIYKEEFQMTFYYGLSPLFLCSLISTSCNSLCRSRSTESCFSVAVRLTGLCLYTVTKR